MKTRIRTILFVLTASVVLVACVEEDVNPGPAFEQAANTHPAKNVPVK